jgi:hypothetical protein
MNWKITPVTLLVAFVVCSSFTIWLATNKVEGGKVLALGENPQLSLGPYIYDPTVPKSVAESVIVQNRTKEVVQVEEIFKSCGCIENLGIDRRPLAPGESTQVSFDVTPSGSVGAKLVNFIFQAEGGKLFPCKFRLLAYPCFHLVEGANWHFGDDDVGSGNEIRKTFTLRTYGEDANEILELIKAECISDGISVKLQNVEDKVEIPTNVLRSEWGIKLTVSDTIQGRSSSIVKLFFKNALGLTRTKDVTISTTFDNRFFSKPSGVFITGKDDASFAKTVMIMSRDRSSFIIDQVLVSSDQISVKFDDIDSATHKLTLSGNAVDFGDSMLEKLTIKIAGQEDLVVKVAGVFRHKANSNEQ